MELETIDVDVDDGVGRIRLNRPGALNAITEGMLGELIEATRRFNDILDVRVVVLSGSGSSFRGDGVYVVGRSWANRERHVQVG